MAPSLPGEPALPAPGLGWCRHVGVAGPGFGLVGRRAGRPPSAGLGVCTPGAGWGSAERRRWAGRDPGLL